MVTDEMTEQEVFMKKTFLAPLADKDKAAWKLGSLNEDNVQSVMKGVVNGVGGELEDIWECGLLRNKTRHWNVTSLDGWMRIKMKALDANVDGSDDDSDVTDSANNTINLNRLVSINCEMEIKTPSSNRVLR